MPKAEKRLHVTALMVGRKGTGKSTELAKIARDYARNNPKKRVLIIDVNGSPAYNDFPLLTPEQLQGWKESASLRIAKFYHSDHDVLFEMVSKFRNGMVVFEDCTKYIGSNPTGAVKMYLVDHRMWQVDLIFTFHSLHRVPKFFWEMTAYIVLKKTQDTEIRNQRGKIPNFQEVEKAWIEVMKSKNDYIHKTVPTLI